MSNNIAYEQAFNKKKLDSNKNIKKNPMINDFCAEKLQINNTHICFHRVLLNNYLFFIITG